VKAEPEKWKAQYLVPFGKVGALSANGRDEKAAEALWGLSERVMGEVLERGKVVA
jgi:hypothetical protein